MFIEHLLGAARDPTGSPGTTSFHPCNIPLSELLALTLLYKEIRHREGK